MNTRELSEASKLFETDYANFEQMRRQVQASFLASRFEMIEQQYFDSGFAGSFDEWLIKHGPSKGGGVGYHFWENTQPYRVVGDAGLWNALFDESGYGHNQGRNDFIEAFNALLKSKGVSVWLEDNGLQMYFQRRP